MKKIDSPISQSQITTNNDASNGFPCASLIFWGIIIAGLLGFAVLALKFWPYTMDDAYITFRYAQNFAAGHGLVFNPGELPRAEGITSPLYAILLSLIPTSVDIVTFSKWIGLFSAGLTALLIGRLILFLCHCFTSLHRSLMLILSAAGACYYLLNPYVVGNAVSGMETALSGLAFALFLLCLLHITSASDRPRHSMTVITAIIGIIVPMLRPDMGLIVIVSIIALLFLCQERRHQLFLILCTFAGLGILYFTARYIYYQMIFPLPFYIKQGGVNLGGLIELFSYIRHSNSLLIFVLFCFSFAISRDSSAKRPVKGFVLALIVGVGCQLLYYATIHHIMGFGLRYFQPVECGVIVLGFVGIGIIYAILTKFKYRNKISLRIVFAGLFGLIFLGHVNAYTSAKHTLIDWYAQGDGEVGITNWQPIIEASRYKSLHIAMNDCGAFPFYTGFTTIDLAGLNNREIALGHSSAATILEIKRKQPSLLFLCGSDKNNTDSLFGWEQLSSSDVFKIGYDYVGAIKVSKNYYWLVFTKPDQTTNHFLEELLKHGIFEYAQVSHD